MLWIYSALLLTGFCCSQGVNLPTATDITVSSINFKTILDWKPEPTDYTYTVLIRNQFSQDWKKKCIHTKLPTCDVTDSLRDTNSTYEFRIVSEVGISETVVEDPLYAEGPKFNPYEQTIIGTPTIQDFMFNKDQSSLTIIVKDPLTPYRRSNTPMTVQDIFKNDYIYTVFYKKVSRTRMQKQSSTTNEIVINTDGGEDYCFYVQTTVPSRKQNRDSEKSTERCTSGQHGGFDTTILVAVGIAVALIILIIIVVLSVILCKCLKGKKEESRETKPLNDV